MVAVVALVKEMQMFGNPLKYWWDRIKFRVMVESIPLRTWWDRLMHKRFHIGWVFAVLTIGIVICIAMIVSM